MTKSGTAMVVCLAPTEKDGMSIYLELKEYEQAESKLQFDIASSDGYVVHFEGVVTFLVKRTGNSILRRLEDQPIAMEIDFQAHPTGPVTAR